MTIMSSTGTRRCDASVDAIRAEFGAILADRIIEAEAMDFLWEARVRERYLGERIDAFSDEEAPLQGLSRVAFLSVLDGDWHAGLCVVDGEGCAVELLWKRRFGSRVEAELAFLSAR